MCTDVSQSQPGRSRRSIARHGGVARSTSVGETADQLARLDQLACPVCGITYLEFRKQGRLGCAHDYEFFQEQLDPLLMNIHDQTHHIGKVPRRCPQGADQQTQLIRLRREMKEAIATENYEQASQLRDQIREIEGRQHSSEETKETEDDA